MAAVERFVDGVSQFSGRWCHLRGCSRQPPPAIFLVLVGRDTMCRLPLRKTMVVSSTHPPFPHLRRVECCSSSHAPLFTSSPLHSSQLKRRRSDLELPAFFNALITTLPQKQRTQLR